MAQAIRLWRSERKGQARGPWLASWKEHGRKVAWSTTTQDKAEAQRKAEAELGRRLQAASPGPAAPATTVAPPAQPDLVTPAATSNGHSRKPITAALTRALSAPAAETTPPSSPGTDLEERPKGKKLYEVGAKALTYLVEGGLKRACRYAGKEPEEMDDDEQALIQEGFEEKLADLFGRTEIGPWGKIILGTAVAGTGMYVGGTAIPKPKQLTPATSKSDEPRKDGDSA